DSTSPPMRRSLDVGSGAGSTGKLATPSNATYRTLGGLASAAAGASAFRPSAAPAAADVSRRAPRSGAAGPSAAAAFGAASENIEATSSTAIRDRAAERGITLNILHLC